MSFDKPEIFFDKLNMMYHGSGMPFDKHGIVCLYGATLSLYGTLACIGHAMVSSYGTMA